MIKRYTQVYDDGGWDQWNEHADGEWVAWDDHEPYERLYAAVIRIVGSEREYKKVSEGLQSGFAIQQVQIEVDKYNSIIDALTKIDERGKGNKE